MRLISNWRAVLRRAWSVRLIVIAGLLSGAEVALEYIDPTLLPTGAMAALSALVTCAALVARIVAQTKLSEGPDA